MNDNIIRVCYYNRYDLSKCGIYEFKLGKKQEIKAIWKGYLKNGYKDSAKTKPISFMDYLYNEEKLIKERNNLWNMLVKKKN